ncbi:hypothetical protein CQA91_20040 [Shigella flexneri]|nr:hypothetical protein BS654_19700 [Shigella flexneri 4c]ASQ80584.1 hypothetical protein B4376_05165 [Shigella flexneri 1a]OOP15782.1 hypothetical protein AJR25_014555 [Shigella flexneri]ASQ58578.1 hypothetical protein BS653_15130 [Shigella flexneri 4c]OXW74330.1 hypothetical protein CG415_17120 [Shigella flexneri]
MSINIDGRDCCQTGQFSQDVADGALTKKSTAIVDKWGYYGYKKTRRGGFFYIASDYSAAASAFSERSTSSM